METHWRTLDQFTRVGSTGKPRGISGELRLYINEEYLDDIVEAEFLFIERDGNKVPLQIESLREIQDLLVKFIDIDDPTQASQWTSLGVYLPTDEVSFAGEAGIVSSLEYQKLLGYTIVDHQLGSIGTIKEIREFPQQEMAVIDYRDREILIPLNPVFIQGVNTDRQELSMDLPEGLLEM